MIHIGDITKIDGAKAPVVDCIIGGSPCQDLSAAGRHAGLKGSRSSLFMEQIRIIKEMRKNDKQNGRTGVNIRPRYMVWENVPGAFTSGTPKGEDFRIVLEETARIVDKTAVIPRPADGKWTNAGCIMGNGWSIAWRVFDAQFYGVPQRRRRIALVADFGAESAPEILFIRKSVSGHTESCEEPRPRIASDFEASIIAGNKGREISELINEIGSTAYGFDQGATRDIGIAFYKEQAKAVVTSAAGGHNGVVVCKKTIGSLCATDYKWVQRQQVEANKLIIHAKAVDLTNQVESDINGTLQASAAHNIHSNNIVRIGYEVRRLTPLECERLQGFPDGWTDIGDYTDSKGKRQSGSDTARYKALGNSIALPSWRWVIKRICACYERPATMASLFDGIGGFPLIWQQQNGNGTCVWASEIEEFPIAVTKKRIL